MKQLIYWFLNLELLIITMIYYSHFKTLNKKIKLVISGYRNYVCDNSYEVEQLNLLLLWAGCLNNSGFKTTQDKTSKLLSLLLKWIKTGALLWTEKNLKL